MKKIKTENNKVTIINGLKFYSFDDVLEKSLKSKVFREAYEEETARLNLVRQVREMRLNKQMTQKTLAKKADMPQSVIARLESGEHSFSLSTLSKIAKVFNKQIQLV